MRQRSLELDGIKRVLFQILTHISPRLISSVGLNVSLSSLYICLSFFFFSFSWLVTHKHTLEQGCWSRPPLRSSNMRLGSRMIKAVAGGLHFETINRPPGAESNSKPSISVSPSSRWHRGRGHAEGERADSASASPLYTAAEKPRSSYGGIPDSLMWFRAGIVDSFSWPCSLWPERAGIEWGEQHFLFPPSRTTVVCKHWYRSKMV